MKGSFSRRTRGMAMGLALLVFGATTAGAQQRDSTPPAKRVALKGMTAKSKNVSNGRLSVRGAIRDTLRTSRDARVRMPTSGAPAARTAAVHSTPRPTVRKQPKSAASVEPGSGNQKPR